MRIFSRAVLAVLGLSISASAVAIPAGYYVGPGDGSIIVFHVLPGGKRATVGAVEAYTGMGWKKKPYTPREVIAAAEVRQGAHEGTLQKISAGHYRFVLGTPAKPSSYCAYTVKRGVPSNGWVLQSPINDNGCDYYHGETWGISGFVHQPLMPYKVSGK